MGCFNYQLVFVLKNYLGFRYVARLTCSSCLFCGWGSCKNGRMMDKWFFPFETHGSVLVSKQYQRTTDGIQPLNWTKAITRPYWNYISCHWLQFPISFVILRLYRIIRQSHHPAGTFKCLHAPWSWEKNCRGDEAMTSLNDQLQLGFAVVSGVLLVNQNHFGMQVMNT